MGSNPRHPQYEYVQPTAPRRPLKLFKWHLLFDCFMSILYLSVRACIGVIVVFVSFSNELN